MANANPARGASSGGRAAAPIDVLSQEVEEMELHEQRRDEHQARMAGSGGFGGAGMGGSFGGGPAHEEVAVFEDAPREYTPPAPAAGGAGASDGYDAAPAPPPDERGSGSGGGEGGALAAPASSIPRAVDGMPAVIDTSDMAAFLMRPGPQGAMVQCYIQRRKSGLARLYPTYEVYLKDGEQFLLAARRRKKQKQSNYKISLDQNDVSRHTDSYFGKLKSNFMGTEFQLYDKGVNPDKLKEEQKHGAHTQVRQELTTVLYKQNVLGARGPRKMKVMVPIVSEEGERTVLRPMSSEETMLERYKAAKEDGDVVILKNKQPKWNDQVGAYVLNFNGRVTRASVKNFQLCNTARDPDTVVMQFGRVGKDAFTMDYQWPLCALQAFGIALSSFDYKIACE